MSVKVPKPVWTAVINKWTKIAKVGFVECLDWKPCAMCHYMNEEKLSCRDCPLNTNGHRGTTWCDGTYVSALYYPTPKTIEKFLEWAKLQRSMTN